MIKLLQKISPRYYALTSALVLAFAIILMPQHTAHAWCATPSGCVTDFVSKFLLETLGRILAAFAFVLDGLLGLTQGIFDLDIIRGMWSIVKNFFNMLFIVILIVVAFATIFDRPKYRVQELLPKLIMVALLINFSLLIGQLVINVSDFMTHTFLEQFQHNPDGSVAISSEFMKGFALQNYAANDGKEFVTNFLKDGIAGVSSLLFFILALLVVIFVFIVAAAMILIRIPILWLLLIFSPAVWFASILPQGQKFWKQWWQHFISWAFFPPFYLFTLIFGKIFIENRDNLTAFARGSHNDLLGVAGFTIANLLFYGVTLTIMGGGLYAAKKSSMFAGTGVLGAADFVGNWAKNRTLGTGISYNALMSAGKSTAERISKEGLPGPLGQRLYGGERAVRERADRITGELQRRLGYGSEGADKAQDNEVKRYGDEFKRRNPNANKETVDNAIRNAKGSELLALRQMRADNGWVDSANEIEDTIQKAGPDSAFTRSYISSLEKNNFAGAFKSPAELEQFANTTNILALKKAAYENLAKNGNIRDKDTAVRILSLFKSDSKEKQDKIKESLQKNIKNFLPDKDSRANFLLNPAENIDIRKLVARQMADDGEINSYKRYATAVELFGGPDQVKSRELLERINRESPATAAEIKFRGTIGITDASYIVTPGSPEEALLRDEFSEKLKRAQTTEIAKADKEQWAQPWFKDALQAHVTELERENPTIFKDDPLFDSNGNPLLDRNGKPRKASRDIPGRGRRFLEILKRDVGFEKEKLNVVDGITV